MFRLAHLLLLLVLTYQLVVQAADASSESPREEAPTNCVDGCSKWTLFNIIWGCLSTMIICAWTAIHPNIPPREGPVKGTFQKLELMFWTIMAPEILPAWALNQRLAAMTIRDLYNKEKGYEQEKCGIWKTLKRWFSFYEIKEAASQAWTLKHGHFVIMGGFHLVEPVEGTPTGQQQAASDVQASTSQVEGTETDAERGCARSGNAPKLEEGRITVLTLEMLRELVKDAEFRIRITDLEIADRSKGDALSKLIFILQSSWFILQCIGRLVQGLSLTQLELTTLALASLNGITFILWWDKPLGVRAPVRVYMNRKLTDAERDKGRASIFTVGTRKVLRHGFKFNWIPLYAFVVVTLPITVIPAFSLAVFATISDLVRGSTSFPADATHVPTFHVPKHQYSKYWHASLLIALGTIFGGIHCAGWNLPFHTSAEQRFWRVASFAVTIIPIGAVPFCFIILTSTLALFFFLKLFVVVIFRLVSGRPSYSIHNLSDFKFYLESSTPSVASMPLLPYFTLAYAAARLVLLGLALALLRHQPPSAFIAVDWTKFYPHIL